MLPYWQENLRAQILQSHKEKYKGTTEALSQCWANKWFMGCTYPSGVHAIIDQWPAPRKEDVDESVSVPKYERIARLASNVNSISKEAEQNKQNADKTSIGNTLTTNNTRSHIGEQRNSDTIGHVQETTDEDFNPRKKRRIDSTTDIATASDYDYDTSSGLSSPLPPPASSISANAAQCITDTDKHRPHHKSRSKKRPRWG